MFFLKILIKTEYICMVHYIWVRDEQFRKVHEEVGGIEIPLKFMD
jgi:hypothetical protein